MATIINNPTPSEPTVVQTESSSGWVVAVVILILVIIGGVIWYYHRHSAVAPQPGAVVNVTVPAAQGSSSGY